MKKTLVTLVVAMFTMSAVALAADESAATSQSADTTAKTVVVKKAHKGKKKKSHKGKKKAKKGADAGEVKDAGAAPAEPAATPPAGETK